MTAKQRQGLSRLLSPKTIAVVGGQAAATVAQKCQRIGFAGDLYAVHPTRSDLAGIPCVKQLGDLPVSPDACFIGVSPQCTVDVVAELAAAGAGGAVCYASGFAEAGVSGEKLQLELIERAGTMPLVGPNCHGFINYLDGVALWPDHFGGERTETGPALIMQSGNIGINVTFQQRGLSFSYVIAMGNNARLEIHDYIHAMLDDPRVTAIGMQLEGISNVSAFSAAALRALRQGVPLVAIKTGSSDLGAQMALSHTRSLARPDALVSVMFERYGIARCASLPELLETLKFVSTGGAIESAAEPGEGVPRPRIASMSCSGGEASHMADLAGVSEVTFPALSEQTTRELSELLGERVHVSNPLDYHTYVWGDETTLTKAFTQLLREPLDCALLILDYPPPELYDVELWQVAERALCAASQATGTRVAVVASLPENFPASARTRLRALGVPPMQGLLECAQAIQHAGTIGRAQQSCASLMPITVTTPGPGPGFALDEFSSKQELMKHGLAVPACARCSVDQAARIATSIGYPVVLKALGAQLAHKTELGAVRAGINSAAQADRHARELGAISKDLLVESMVEDAVVELLVGITHDADFGQVLVLGAGGIQVELLRDTVQLLLPVSREQIGRALNSLKVGELLAGYRGSQAGDTEAAIDAIASICAYAREHSDSLLELDVNPLLVRPLNRNQLINRDAIGGESLWNGSECESVRVEKSDRSDPGAVAVDALIRKC